MPGQRTYVKDRNENNNPKQIKIVLVREVFLANEKSILMFTYSNLLGDNFNAIILSSENSNF